MMTFNATFGVYPGYVNLSSEHESALDKVAIIWQEAAEKEVNNGGM